MSGPQLTAVWMTVRRLVPAILHHNRVNMQIRSIAHVCD
jgi:hypothetical protein